MSGDVEISVKDGLWNVVGILDRRGLWETTETVVKAIDALEAQEARIKTLEKALKDAADDIDLEAKYASRSGQMDSLEEIARVMRLALSKAPSIK